MSAVKEFLKNVCISVGHIWSTPDYKPLEYLEYCARCGKRYPYSSLRTFPINKNPKVRYADIKVQRFDLYGTKS